jgi:hypothetical protein
LEAEIAANGFSSFLGVIYQICLDSWMPLVLSDARNQGCTEDLKWGEMKDAAMGLEMKNNIICKRSHTRRDGAK